MKAKRFQKPYAQWSADAKERQMQRVRVWQKDQLKSGNCSLCVSTAAERIIMQDGNVMHRKKLQFCFTHLRRHNVLTKKWQKANSIKGVCSICHEKPAELCAACRDEKRQT